MANFGVFICSAQSDDDIIDKCRELLQSFQSDMKILHVSRDHVHNGLKVFFDSDSGIRDLLMAKFLSDGDESSTIHSLTTALRVHQAFPNNEKEFKESIRIQIGNFMSVQVLDIKKVPINSKYPEIGDGKWIIVLSIPEIDELDEFKTMGLPYSMVLKFPTNDDSLRVEFYCRLCQKDGHVQSRCLDLNTTHSLSSIHSNTKDPRPKEIPYKSDLKGLFAEKIHSLDTHPLQKLDGDASCMREGPLENSPVVTTTSNYPLVKRELPSTSANQDEDSNPNPPKRPKKTMHLLKVVIPDRIRNIISGMPKCVLDVRQLEAFFNHVKKKSRPSVIADIYTSDVEGLHSQLVEIKCLYYRSPKVGSNVDIQFMKMLENVLKRFYNKPPQRKSK